MRLVAERFLSGGSHVIYAYKEVDQPLKTYVSYNVAGDAGSPSLAESPMVIYYPGSTNGFSEVT